MRSLWGSMKRSGVILVAAVALSLGSFLTTMEGFYSFLSPKPSALLIGASPDAVALGTMESFARSLGLLGGGDGSGGAELQPVRTTVLTVAFTVGVQGLLYSISFLIGQRLVKSSLAGAEGGQGPRLIKTGAAPALAVLAALIAWIYVAPGNLWIAIVAAIIAGLLGLIFRFVIFADRGAFTAFFLFAAYTIVLGLSALFSFEAIYRFILTEEEAKREADAVLMEEYPLLVTEIGVVLDKQRAGTWARLIASPAFSQVMQQREDLKLAIRAARAALERSQADRIDAIRSAEVELSKEIADTDRRMAALNRSIAEKRAGLERAVLGREESEKALAIAQQALEDELTRRGRPEDIQARMQEAKQRMQFEEEGLQGAEEGRGPKYRAAKADHDNAQRELQLVLQEIQPRQEAIRDLRRKIQSFSTDHVEGQGTIRRLEEDKADLELARQELSGKRLRSDADRGVITQADPVDAWIKRLGDSERDFIARRNPDRAVPFEEECRGAHEALAAVSLSSAALPSGACWHPDLDLRLTETRRLEAASSRFATACMANRNSLEVVVTDPLRAARDCFRLAGILGAEALRISRRFTALEAEYGGVPNLRRAISNVARGEKFAVGAAGLALAIDLLILICGIIAGLLAQQYSPGRPDRLSPDEQLDLIAASLTPRSPGEPAPAETVAFITDLLRPTEDPAVYEIRSSDVMDPADQRRLSRFLTAVRPIGTMETASDGSAIHRVPVRLLHILKVLKTR